MASKSPNLKVNVTADTSDLNRGLKESKAAVRDFESTTSNAIGAIGSLFGVNTQAVEKMSSAIKGLGIKMQESGNSGSASFGKLLTSVNGLAAGMAGIGIAGVVAGFKLLNEEATAFKNTVQGANIELQTNAYIETYAQSLHDANESIGSGTAETISGLERSWKSFWADAKHIAVNTIAEISTDGLFGAGDRALASWQSGRGAASENADEAMRIAKEMYDIQRQISNQSVVWAQQEAAIAENKRIAYDKTQDLATQQQALAEAAKLINERYSEEADLRQRLAELQAEMNSLASSSVEDVDLENQLKVQAFQTTVRMDNALRELSERQASLTASAKAEADARAKSLAAAQQMTQSRADLNAWRENSGITTSVDTPALENTNAPGIIIPVKPVLDGDSVIDISREIEATLIPTFDAIGTSLGGLIGDLASGGDAWSNFSSTAIGALGDLAISVGKMAISTGVATLGIKAALESLNGYAAIAAGVALVALGTAVKSSMSNMASGNYSAGSVSSVASSVGGGYGSSLSNEYNAREMSVRVTGTLVGSGSTLKAVLDNELNRTNQTT